MNPLKTVSISSCKLVNVSNLIGDVHVFYCSSRKYNTERITSNLRVSYYVKSDFKVDFKGDLRRIERNVEEEYISNLRQNCWRERSYSKFVIHVHK